MQKVRVLYNKDSTITFIKKCLTTFIKKCLFSTNSVVNITSNIAISNPMSTAGKNS